MVRVNPVKWLFYKIHRLSMVVIKIICMRLLNLKWIQWFRNLVLLVCMVLLVDMWEAMVLRTTNLDTVLCLVMTTESVSVHLFNWRPSEKKLTKCIIELLIFWKQLISVKTLETLFLFLTHFGMSRINSSPTITEQLTNLSIYTSCMIPGTMSISKNDKVCKFSPTCFFEYYFPIS